MTTKNPTDDFQNENQWLHDSKPDLTAEENRLNFKNLAKLPEIIRLGARYWFSKDAAWAWALSIVLFALSTGIVQLNVRFASWYKTFYDAMENKNVAEFWSAISMFSILATLWVLVNTYNTYVKNVLQLRWRTWLSERYTKQYLNNNRFYYLEHQRSQDNPDQRIADDLDAFTNLALNLFFGLFISVFSIFEFSRLMLQVSGDIDLTLFGRTFHIPDYMFYMNIVYILLGSFLLHFIGRRLVKLSFLREQVNANFRYHLIRAREYAEGISFLNGAKNHIEQARQRFGIVRSNQNTFNFRTKLVNLAQFSIGQASVIFPFLVASPRYFGGEITLGSLMQISSTFGKLSDALSWFIDNYATLASFRASSTRIINLEKALARVDDLAQKNTITVTPNNVGGVVLTHLSLNVPRVSEAGVSDEKLQVSGVDWHILPGDRWLITGESGAGKSTILRAIAQLWPYGNGQIDVPNKARIAFVPQRPYMPLGTLREALAYPDSSERYNDEAYRTVLEMVNLPHLNERLNENNNWGWLLSGGEQQRLAFARILLQRPDYVFLDEATSALDGANENQMYTTLLEFLPKITLISISHHEQLKAHHGKELKLVPDGKGSYFAQLHTL